MSSMRLKDIIAKVPNEREAIERLEAFLSRTNQKGLEFPATRLYEIMRPSSLDALGKILVEIERSGLFRSFFRLESAEGIGIHDYETVAEIPSVAHDLNTDSDVRVTPNNIRVFYRVVNGDR